MSARLAIAVPSKGRLKEQATDLFARAGLALQSKGHERLYRGTLAGIDGVEVVYTSAAEIVHELKSGRVQLGVTGEDLIRETLADVDGSVEFVAPLGFGRADVVVAVPDCWIDVDRMTDLEDVAAQFSAAHGRRLRVATKYMNLTRRFFAASGVTGYRIVESVGATEATPCGWHGGADRRHHHHRHHAPRQSSEGPGGRADPQVAGASVRLARGALGCRRRRPPRRHCGEIIDVRGLILRDVRVPRRPQDEELTPHGEGGA